MKQKKGVRITLIALAIVISLLVVYYYPFQWFLCRHYYSQYIEQQGIEKEDIEWTRADKIAKVDGWELTAKYKSDPENIYMYYYHLHGTSGTKMRLGAMSCLVQTKNGEDAITYRYAPLEEN